MIRLLLPLLIAAVPLVAWAHTSEHAVDPLARHGGLAKRAGDYNLEFVADPLQFQLFVNSQGNRPLSTSGAVADLRIMHDAGAMDIQLQPAGGNRLAADWQAPVGESIRAILTLTMYGSKPVKRLVLGIPVLDTQASVSEEGEPSQEFHDE